MIVPHSKTFSSLACLGMCVAQACVPASTTTDAASPPDAFSTDARLADDSPALDDSLRVLTAEPETFAYGAVYREGLLGSTTPVLPGFYLRLGFWPQSDGCERALSGYPGREIIRLGMIIRGRQIDETHDLPPTVGTYEVVPGIRTETVGHEQAHVTFILVRDGVLAGEIEGISGTLTIEAMSTTELTLYVDAMLEGDVPIRGRVTIGYCGPPP